MAKRVMNGGARLQKSASQGLNRRSRGDPLGNMLQRANDRANMAIARKLRAAGIVIKAPDPNDPNGIRKMAAKNKKKLEKQGIVKKKSLQEQVFGRNLDGSIKSTDKVTSSKKSIHEGLGKKLLEKERDLNLTNWKNAKGR